MSEDEPLTNSSVVPVSSRDAAPPAKPGVHYLALDGLRGLAILAVFLFHFGGGSHQATSVPIRVWLTIVHSGWMGVDLFFVLSGFLITGILYDTAHKENKMRNFYARRTLRIFPLFYGVLFGFLLLTPVLHLHWKPGHALYFLYLYNMVPLLDPGLNSPGQAMVPNHLWSLAVEEQFYLLWPFVVWSLRDRRKLLWTSLALMITSFLLRSVMVLRGDTQIVYALLPTRADSLLFGAAVALLVRGPNGQRLPVGRVALISGVLSLAVLLSGHVSAYRVQLISTAGYTAIGVFFACIVYWAQQGQLWVTRIFGARWLRFFGRYSYGLYLYQGFLLEFMFRRVHVLQRWVHSETIGAVLFILIAMGILLAISMLSYHLFEEPLIRLKRHFA